MSPLTLLSIGFVVTGFLVAALISERSLRGVATTTQGELLVASSRHRTANLVAIPLIIAVGLFFPGYGWFALASYFAIFTVVAISKLWRLDLPQRLRNQQAAAVVAVFIGVVLAAGTSFLAQRGAI